MFCANHCINLQLFHKRFVLLHSVGAFWKEKAQISRQHKWFKDYTPSEQTIPSPFMVCGFLAQQVCLVCFGLFLSFFKGQRAPNLFFLNSNLLYMGLNLISISPLKPKQSILDSYSLVINALSQNITGLQRTGKLSDGYPAYSCWDK